jgi:hypothetical protein
LRERVKEDKRERGEEGRRIRVTEDKICNDEKLSVKNLFRRIIFPYSK